MEDTSDDEKGSAGKEEADSDDEALEKRKCRSARDGPPPPTQEAYYPLTWKQVFKLVKIDLFIYLILSDLFPDQEPMLGFIDRWLMDAVAVVEMDLKMYLPIGA